MHKILCLLGFHQWRYVDWTHRGCIHCPKREVQVYDFYAPYWVEE